MTKCEQGFERIFLSYFLSPIYDGLKSVCFRTNLEPPRFYSTFYDTGATTLNLACKQGEVDLCKIDIDLYFNELILTPDQ
jgi:hypothetical protein